MSAGGGLFRQITYPLRDQLGVTDAVGTGDPLERDPGLRGKPADCDDAARRTAGVRVRVVKTSAGFQPTRVQAETQWPT